jgi:hypothetical protein
MLKDKEFQIDKYFVKEEHLNHLNENGIKFMKQIFEELIIKFNL